MNGESNSKNEQENIKQIKEQIEEKKKQIFYNIQKLRQLSQILDKNDKEMEEFLELSKKNQQLKEEIEALRIKLFNYSQEILTAELDANANNNDIYRPLSSDDIFGKPSQSDYSDDELDKNKDVVTTLKDSLIQVIGDDPEKLQGVIDVLKGNTPDHTDDTKDSDEITDSYVAIDATDETSKNEEDNQESIIAEENNEQNINLDFINDIEVNYGENSGSDTSDDTKDSKENDIIDDIEENNDEKLDADASEDTKDNDEHLDSDTSDDHKDTDENDFYTDVFNVIEKNDEEKLDSGASEDTKNHNENDFYSDIFDIIEENDEEQKDPNTDDEEQPDSDNIDDNEEPSDDTEEPIIDDSANDPLDDEEKFGDDLDDKTFLELIDLFKQNVKELRKERLHLIGSRLKIDVQDKKIINNKISLYNVIIKALKKCTKENKDKLVSLIQEALNNNKDINAVIKYADLTNSKDIKYLEKLKQDEKELKKKMLDINKVEKELTETDKDNREKALFILKTVIGISSIILAAALISNIADTINKSNKSKNDEDNDDNKDYSVSYTDSANNQENNDPTYGDNTPDNIDSAISETYDTFNKLRNIGYNDYQINLLTNSNNKDLLDKLLNMNYAIPSIENYIYAINFDPNNITYYEDARVRFNLSGENAVDIVNRSLQLYNVGYFNNSNNDLTTLYNILTTIDNKTLYMSDNPACADLVNELADISMDVINDTFTEQDGLKIKNLKLFAKEGSDLEANLNQLSTLIYENYTNPNNKDNYNSLFNHVNITTHAFGGDIDDSKYLTDNQKFNQNAMLENTEDYATMHYIYFALQSGITDNLQLEEIKKWSNLESIRNELILNKVCTRTNKR